MPLTFADVAWGFALPAVVTGAVLLLLRLVLPAGPAGRYPAPVAMTAGFLLGYGLLELAPWEPTSHWHWLPYLAIAAAILGAVATAEGVPRGEAWLVYVLVAVAAGWFLVPTWEDLEPSRTVHLIVFVLYMAVLAALLEPLAKRFAGAFLAATLSVCLVAVAAILVTSGSLRFAQIAGAGAGATVGCTVALLSRKGESFAGAALLYSVFAVGLMLVGRTNSHFEVPLLSYVLVPAAPLLLWVGAGGPVARLAGARRWAALAALVAVPLVVAVAIAAASEISDGEY